MTNNLTTNLTFYYQNCRGLRTKLNTLYMNILVECYDIIILTETWLIPEIPDSLFIDSRYIVFRCDRDRISTGKKEGGGVLVAVRCGLPVTRRLLPVPRDSDPSLTNNSQIDHNIDYVVIDIQNNHEKLLLCALYIPPNQSYDTYKTFLNSLSNTITSQNYSYFYVVGDFNIPSLEWISGDHPGALTPQLSRDSSCIDKYIVNLLNYLNAYQYNILKNDKGRTLDLFITNSLTCTCEVPLKCLVPVDPFHPIFLVNVSLNIDFRLMSRNSAPRHRFTEANYAIINEAISDINWHDILQNLPIDDAVEIFYENIYRIIKQYVPARPTKNNDFPIWFTKPLIHIFKNKNNAWIKWKKYKNHSDYETFSLYRERFKTLCPKFFDNYINSLEEGIRDDIRLLWSYVDSRKQKNGIPDEINYLNYVTNNPSEACELFLNFFSSVYEPSDPNNTFIDPSCLGHSNNADMISNIHFSMDAIVSALKSLDVTKGAGPDGIPPIFFKLTRDTICLPLYVLFNQSISEGKLPSIWKSANVVPVHKSGSRHDVQNYRPISLLSTLPKVLERLVHDAIYPTLHPIIIPEQHGFVKKRSTLTNLVTYSTFLFECMDNRKQVDSVYTDFCKAFDKVDHGMLLRKIAFNGIRGNLFRWFQSYITNRTQKVVVNGYASSSIQVTSGVAQGSILGPLLFVLFVNDISECFINSNFLLYADDLKIYRTISSYDDCMKLQQDLNRLSDYCNINKLFLSLPKCKTITFTKNKHIIHHKYHLNNIPLETVPLIRDLGILFDSKLHFNTHIDHITSKAYKLFGFITRSCSAFKRPSTYLYLYKTLIRSQIEYAVIVWNPFYDKYHKQLESIQRKFLRYVNCKCYHFKESYENLLLKFSIDTLKSRRSVLSSSFLYNLCHNKYDCIDLINKINYQVPSRSKRILLMYPHRLFSLPLCKTNAGSRAPLCRVMNLYNVSLNEIDIFCLSPSLYKKQITLTLAPM